MQEVCGGEVEVKVHGRELMSPLQVNEKNEDRARKRVLTDVTDVGLVGE